MFFTTFAPPEDLDMSKLMCGSCFSSLLGVLVTFTASHGQESASLPELGVEMTHSRQAPPPLPITPKTIEGGSWIQPELAELYHVLPMRWELEKHHVYQDLMREEIATIEEELNEATEKQEQLITELTNSGTTTLEQLDEKHLSLQAAKLEEAVLEAESAALRDAIDRRKETLAAQGGEKIGEAIELQKLLIKAVDEKRRYVAEMRAKGVASVGDLSEAEAEVLRARRELSLMEAEAMQKSDLILDAVLKRLAEIGPQRKATAAKIERLSRVTEQAHHLRQLIQEREQIKRDIERLDQRKSALTNRLREQKLRTAYLEVILKRYESSFDKVSNSSKEEGDGT